MTTNDSLINALRNAIQNQKEAVDLIKSVDDFYNSAWEKLILFGSLALGIIGIVVPFFIQWYQKKTLKISEGLLQKKIKEEASQMKTDILTDVNKTLNEKFTEFEEEIKKIRASANAKTFHLQGNTQLSIGDIYTALSDFINAGFDYLYCEDIPNLQVVLNNISTSCLQKLSSDEITDLKISHNCDLDALLQDISNKDKDGVFLALLREIRLKLSKLPKSKTT